MAIISVTTCFAYAADHVVRFGLLPPFLHTASDQKLEAGTAWERGHTNQYCHATVDYQYAKTSFSSSYSNNTGMISHVQFKDGSQLAPAQRLPK